MARMFSPVQAAGGVPEQGRGDGVMGAGAEPGLAETLITRARELAPVLHHRARACEERRSLLPETVADFRAAGFLRVLQVWARALAAHGQVVAPSWAK